MACTTSGVSRTFAGGGSGEQCISPVVIYRKFMHKMKFSHLYLKNEFLKFFRLPHRPSLNPPLHITPKSRDIQGAVIKYENNLLFFVIVVVGYRVSLADAFSSYSILNS